MYAALYCIKTLKVYILITIVITLWLQIGCASRVETQTVPIDDSSTTISEALARSENLFAQRDDIEKLREAVQTLSKVRNPNTRNFEVEWKFAKYNYFLGKIEPEEKDAEKAFEKGRDAGRIASRVDPARADGHFWYGANLGELSRISPITVGLKSIDDIREAMSAAIAIQPEYQGASAYDALGQLELATQQFGGGKAEKAVEYLEKGLALNSQNSNIRLHLAEAYLALDKDAEAKKYLNSLLQMKPNPDYLPEHQAAVTKAKKLIESRF